MDAPNPDLVKVEIELRQDEYNVLRAYADQASTKPEALITMLLLICLDNPQFMSQVIHTNEAKELAQFGPFEIAALTGWPWKKPQ